MNTLGNVAEICGNRAKELFMSKYEGVLTTMQLVADTPLVEFQGLIRARKWEYLFEANTDFGRIPFVCLVSDEGYIKANWVFFYGSSDEYKNDTLKFLKMVIDAAEENGCGKSQGNQGVYWLSELYEYITKKDIHGNTLFFHVNYIIGAMKELQDWRKYIGGEDVLNKYKAHQEKLEREKENDKYHSQFD